MKTWVKAALFSLATFLVLGLVSMFIAYGTITSGSFVSDSTPLEPKNGYHDKRVEDMINKQVQAQNILNDRETYDLDDFDQRDNLKDQGLVLEKGQKAHMKVIENASTGFKWIVDMESCAKQIEFMSEFVMPQ